MVYCDWQLEGEFLFTTLYVCCLVPELLPSTGLFIFLFQYEWVLNKEIVTTCKENRVKFLAFTLMPVVSLRAWSEKCICWHIARVRSRVFVIALLSHLLSHSFFSLGESGRRQTSLSTWISGGAEGWEWIVPERVSSKFGRGRYSSLIVSALRWLMLLCLPTLLLSYWPRWGHVRNTEHCVWTGNWCKERQKAFNW